MRQVRIQRVAMCQTCASKEQPVAEGLIGFLRDIFDTSLDYVWFEGETKFTDLEVAQHRQQQHGDNPGEVKFVHFVWCTRCEQQVEPFSMHGGVVDYVCSGCKADRKLPLKHEVA